MVLKAPAGVPVIFVYEGFTLSARAFPARSTNNWICNSLDPRQKVLLGLTTPILQRPPPITQNEFRLFPFRSPLLRE